MDPQGKYIITDFLSIIHKAQIQLESLQLANAFQSGNGAERQRHQEAQRSCFMAFMSSSQGLEKSSLNYISLFKHEDKLQWFHNMSFKLTILLFWGAPEFKHS